MAAAFAAAMESDEHQSDEGQEQEPGLHSSSPAHRRRGEAQRSVPPSSSSSAQGASQRGGSAQAHRWLESRSSTAATALSTQQPRWAAAAQGRRYLGFYAPPSTSWLATAVLPLHKRSETHTHHRFDQHDLLVSCSLLLSPFLLSCCCLLQQQQQSSCLLLVATTAPAADPPSQSPHPSAHRSLAVAKLWNQRLAQDIEPILAEPGVLQMLASVFVPLFPCAALVAFPHRRWHSPA
eukprot:SAG11_NODE_2100_length_3826_cov_40.900456_1_plen_236_part_00